MFDEQPFLVICTVYVPAAVGKMVALPAVPLGMPGPVQLIVSPVSAPVAVSDGVFAHAPVPAAVIDTTGLGLTVTMVLQLLSVQPEHEIVTDNV